MTTQPKTAIATDAFTRGDYVKALRILKDFGRMFDRDDLRILQIAYESLTGRASFYNNIGVDTVGTIKRAKELIKLKYKL